MKKRLTEKLLSLVVGGTGNDQILIIAGEETKALDLNKVEETHLLIPDQDRAELATYLKEVGEVSETAKQLGVSRARAGRIRKALGLTDEYTGQSRTTLWRKKKKKGEDEDEFDL